MNSQKIDKLVMAQLEVIAKDQTISHDFLLAKRSASSMANWQYALHGQRKLEEIESSLSVLQLSL